MDIERFRRLLYSVGLETFVKYFEEFEQNLDNEVIFERFEKNLEDWNESAFITKANTGKAIFSNEMELEALDYIIEQANENKLNNGQLVKKRALKIRNEYLRKN